MYILLLRVTKQLQTKNDTEQAIERKEQGFTLYLNGANQDSVKKLKLKTTKSDKTHPQKKRAKTSRGSIA